MEVLNNTFKFLFFVIAITINSSSPLPSLPLIIFNYISNNFLFAFFSSLSGSVLASYLQYLFVNKIYRLNKVKTLNKIKKFILKKLGKKRNSLKKYAQKIRILNFIKFFFIWLTEAVNLSFLDFLFLRLSAAVSFKATNLICGLIGYPLKKFLFITILCQIPWNIFYYFAVKSNNLIDNEITDIKFSELNINILGISFIDFIYSITLIYLISRLISYLIRKYNNFIN